VQVTASREEAEASVNQAVVGAFVLQEAAMANEQAVQLRDEGRVDEARQLLQFNAMRLARCCCR
jgi:hypothetical protein